MPDPQLPGSELPVQAAANRQAGRQDSILRGALLTVAMLYLFIAAINLMGHGLEVAAKDPGAKAVIDGVFRFAEHPVVGLCVGIVVTAIVQSSSFTTSLVVGLVAANQLTLKHAVPIVMGTNIGTTITAMLVCLGHMRWRLDFRRALGGASVNVLFKAATMFVLFPLELAFGVISRPASAMGAWLGSTSAFRHDPGDFNIVKMAVSPLRMLSDWLFTNMMGLSKPWAGGLTATLALIILFVALVYIVKGLKGMLMQRLSGLFERVLFARPWTAFAVGIITTSLVQSSSVTTSLAIPLLAAGILRLRQVYPYMLGSDIGTTVTAVLAALAAAATTTVAGASSGALAVAAAHLLFNLVGVAIFWPLGFIPLTFAKSFASAASRRRWWVAVIILALFFVAPILVIVIVSYL